MMERMRPARQIVSPPVLMDALARPIHAAATERGPPDAKRVQSTRPRRFIRRSRGEGGSATLPVQLDVIAVVRVMR